jgi:putative spermidine/putrescine transport system permease protein
MAGQFSRGSLSARFGKPFVMLVLVSTLFFLAFPVIVTFLSSFASDWYGVLPSGFFTGQNWMDVIVGTDVGADVSVGSSLLYSMGLALGGVIINLIVGIPIAYAVARYDFWGDDWVNTFAILPLAPGIILGIAFLRTYPDLSTSGIALIIGYSLLKAPYMVMAVQSSFQSMDLQQIEESARSLGASWPRAFVTVIIPNARTGIIAGSIISWTLAAAEFNFSYIVYSRGTPPLSIFLFNNITNASFLNAAAAVSIFFLMIALVTIALQIVGNRSTIQRV